MRKITRLTESDLKRITKKVINESFNQEYLKLEDEKLNVKKSFETVMNILDEMEHFSKKGMSVDQFNQLNFLLKRKLNMINQDLEEIHRKVKKYENYLMYSSK